MKNLSKIELYNGDCLEIMKNIPDSSVDMILCDPPYGTTPLKWDSVIPFDKMWEEYYRIGKENCPFVIFGNEPFSTFLRISNIKDYKYDWYWQKERLTNIFQVKKRCGKVIENIVVFYKKQPIYNPQKNEHNGPLVKNKIGYNAGFSIIQSGKSEIKPNEYKDDGTRFPIQILKFNRENQRNLLHPTQKPVELLEYLIKTYTNEKMTVLDNCMGSGSTGIAAINTNRNFIGIELDENYFNIAKERIGKAIKERDNNV